MNVALLDPQNSLFLRSKKSKKVFFNPNRVTPPPPIVVEAVLYQDINIIVYCDDHILDYLFFIGVDECEKEQCFNGGQCHDTETSFICTCAAGFTGTFCQTGWYY